MNFLQIKFSVKKYKDDYSVNEIIFFLSFLNYLDIFYINITDVIYGIAKVSTKIIQRGRSFMAT